MAWRNPFSNNADRAFQDKVLSYLKAILKQERTDTVTLQELKAQVDANAQVEASAVTLIQGIATQLEALKNDPQAIQELADELKASGDSLAAAVTANTPAQ